RGHLRRNDHFAPTPDVPITTRMTPERTLRGHRFSSVGHPNCSSGLISLRSQFVATDALILSKGLLVSKAPAAYLLKKGDDGHEDYHRKKGCIGNIRFDRGHRRDRSGAGRGGP